MFRIQLFVNPFIRRYGICENIPKASSSLCRFYLRVRFCNRRTRISLVSYPLHCSFFSSFSRTSKAKWRKFRVKRERPSRFGRLPVQKMEKMTREMGGTEGDVDGGEIAVESGGKGTAAAAKTRPAAALSFLEEINERKKADHVVRQKLGPSYKRRGWLREGGWHSAEG